MHIEAMAAGSGYLVVDNVGRVFWNLLAPPTWNASGWSLTAAPYGWLKPGEQVTSLSLEPGSDGYRGGGWMFTSLAGYARSGTPRSTAT